MLTLQLLFRDNNYSYFHLDVWHVTNVECYQAWEESYEYLTSAEYSHDTFVSIA